MPDPIGLSSKEALERLKSLGPNEIVPLELSSRLQELKRILLDPMALMLLGLSGLYALLREYRDSLALLIAVLPITAVDVLLEIRAGQALRALRGAFRPVARVYRDGVIREIPTRELVPGDVVVFEEGQALPADGEAIEASALTVNEAALTGESVPVEKNAGDPFYGGTLILQGSGLGRITRTGASTRFGKIAGLVKETEGTETPLQRLVRAGVRRVFAIALALALILFFLEWARKGEWTRSLITALTFAMSAIPEEFPIVFTLYLSLGAWRLSRHGVLVKSLPSVETLGSVDVICTDKTGTLTEGRFQLIELRSLRPEVPGTEIERIALMACAIHPVDAMERAIHDRFHSQVTALLTWNLRYEFPFDRQKKLMSQVWESKSGNRACVAMKGAVEGVIRQCRGSAEEHAIVLALADHLSQQGHRLLGLASREGGFTGIRDEDESGLTFLGILIFDDPIRESVSGAIEECRKAGILIKIVTGDHPSTARAVAEKLKIGHSGEDVFTGEDLLRMDGAKRIQAYRDGVIFARVLPEQKHEMVRVLKEQGRVVAMTGDGINDAPALKLADIGISMGVDATDAARSSAHMVLLKNDFGGIVHAVFEGRRIFSNLKRSFSYLISFHFPVIFLALVPALLGWGDLLLPIHIILLELVVHPVSAFTFENLAPLSMAEKEARPGVRMVLFASLSGILLSVASLAAFRMHQGSGIEAARTIALATVWFGNVFFVLVESWPSPGVRFYLTSGILTVLAFLLFRIPALAGFFHLAPASGGVLLAALVLGAASSLPSWVLRHGSGRARGLRS